MSKKFKLMVTIVIVILFVSVAWAQLSQYFLSVYVRTQLLMQDTAPVYLNDDGTYLYSPSDGNATLVSDGGLFLDTDDSLMLDIGSNSLHIVRAVLDTGANGANYDTLLIVISTGASSGTTDYDSICIPIISTNF